MPDVINKAEKLMNIKCPKCGHEQAFLGYNCINATEENGMLQKIKDGSCFLMECNECGTKINVEYSFLYHQVDDNLMIHYAIRNEEVNDVIASLTKPKNDVQRQIVRNLSGQNYIIRIVRSKAELIEKISIYEQGLDDRYVELVKLISASGFAKDHPDKKITHVIFISTADEGRILQLYVDGKAYAKTAFNMELYKKLIEDMSDKLKPLRSDKNLIVNQLWAAGFMKSIKVIKENI